MPKRVLSLLLIAVFVAPSIADEPIPEDLRSFIETRDPASEVSKEAIPTGGTAVIASEEEKINEALRQELQGASPLKALSLPEPPRKFQISTLFSPEENPGYGSLVFTQGEQGEEIKFGAETGHYGYGVTFFSELLPQPHRHEFSKKVILQFSLGTLASRLAGRVPQFGSLMVITSGIPTSPQTYLVRLQAKDNMGRAVKNGAVILISSPGSRQEQGDEDKLRGTYFSKSGRLILNPVSETKSLSTSLEGEQLRFKVRMFELQFEASLVTPFNTQVKGGLDGRIAIPLYWPANEAARAVMTDLAAQSLDDTGSLGDRSLSGK